ncbi:hypothetical protein [Methylobacterium sp. 17Sr1-1]
MSIVGRREEKASLGTKDVGKAKRRFAEHAANSSRIRTYVPRGRAR